MKPETIYEKIVNKGQEKANLINEEALTEAQIVSDKIVNNAQKEADKILRDARIRAESIVGQKKNSLELEKRQASLRAQQAIIEEVFENVWKTIQAYEGKKLLDFAVSLIKQENLLGNETIAVNKSEYDKYLKAFSTNKKANLVELNLLNASLNDPKYQLKLTNQPAKIKDGFLVIGKYFDLNFSFIYLVLNLQKKYEKELLDLIFKD